MISKANLASIGVFDSGVGGLSVLREIRRALPNEDLLYVADSAAAPYGDRPAAFITARAQAIVEFFLAENVKAVVVACNTATAVAVQTLRARYDIPIVAMEPAVKPAVELTQSRVVGVLATSQTLASDNYARLAEKFGGEVEIIPQPCPELVTLVENAVLQGPEVDAAVARYVTPLIARGVDTLVLGCTHYPFLLGAIRAVAGPNVRVIDPATAVARELRRRLEVDQLLSAQTCPGRDRFWSSGQPARVQAVFGKLWGSEVAIHPLPARYAYAMA